MARLRTSMHGFARVSARALLAAWAVLAADRVPALKGVVPGVGNVSDAATASASGGVWIDSNLWLVRSFKSADPVWISHRPPSGSPESYFRSIADAAAAGGRWIVELDDTLRTGLGRGDSESLSLWRRIGAWTAFFEEHAEWRGYEPFGTVGIILDRAASEEYLNLVARRRIPYRVLERAELGSPALAGLRALVAFDLAPPTEAERKVLRAFAEEGGLVLIGPSWGGAPKEQSYTIVAAGDGEVAVYKEDAPDPEVIVRDLNDLVPTTDFGVSVMNAPSVLMNVSRSGAGSGLLIQLVNYAGAPAESVTIWAAGKFDSAKLYAPESEPAEIAVRRSGSRTEIVIPELAVYGALLLQ